MFLEQLGKFFFLKMRPFFFFILLAIPLLASGFFLYQEFTNLNELEERFSNALHKQKSALEKKGRKERFLERYSNPDPYFLDNRIEGFSLLLDEKKKIESLLSHPAFPASVLLKERLSFIEQNKLAFAEGHLSVSQKMKEVEEKQRHPVQMDEQDLKAILALVEDLSKDASQKGMPQLIIKDFKLKKIETPLNTEIFEVEMDIIKREFIKK